MIFKNIFYVIIVIATHIIHTTQASEIEIGAGAFTTSLPKYLGSNEQSIYTLPFPYFYYRSKKVEIDRNAFTGFLWHQKQWYIDLSASGNIPVKSNKTQIRQNMPDIDFVGELGPAIKYYFLGDPNSEQQLAMAFNIRKAMASDFSNITSIGWHYSATIGYNTHLTPVLNGDIELNSLLSINSADNRYLDYYYGVSKNYQTPNRPIYHTKSGYAGSSISVGITWKKESLWLGSFIKYNSLQYSTQLNSPLVTTNHNWSLGLGLVWIFYNTQ